MLWKPLGKVKKNLNKEYMWEKLLGDERMETVNVENILESIAIVIYTMPLL
jgi:hypothetical protein